MVDIKDEKDNNIQTDEIDFIQLIQYLLVKRKIILFTIVISSLIGGLIGIVIPEEYQAKTVFIAQENGKSSTVSGLSGLAAMAGVNLSSSNSIQSLPPILYSNIVSSVPFQKKIMQSYITLEHDSITIYDYFSNIKTENNTLTKSPFVYLTREEKNVSDEINSRILLEVDNETQSITVKCNFPTALMAAQACDIYVNTLQDFITTFKIKKASEQYDFVLERYLEQKEIVEKLNIEIAELKDHNKNFTTAKSQIAFQRLNNEYSVNFSVYTELAKQLEQSKLLVKQNRPIFTMLEPISIPTYRSKPRKLMYLVISIVIGVVLCCVILSLKYIISNIYNKG